MRELVRTLLVISAVSALPLLVTAQDGQSLGDVARQTRQQNQKKDSTDGQPPKPSKVLSNDEIPRATGDSAESSSGHHSGPSSNSTRSTGKLSAEQWRIRILAAKNAISSTQSEIDRATAAIHYAPATCTQNCVTRNEKAMEKAFRVDQLRVQLENQKKALQDMQEAARRQGYGNAVYDP